MKVGLKDIAKQAGVSAVTVSAAINGTGRVSKAKRREILQIAERLKYQPNTLAQMLKSKEKDAIGLVINDVPESIPGSGVMTELVVEFIRYCEAGGKNYHIEFCDPYGVDKVPDILSSGFVGGVISAGYFLERQTRYKNWVATHPEFPFVKFEEPFDYSVRTDFVKGVMNALKYLREQGHVNVALHVGPLHFDIHNLVHRGFTQGVDLFSMVTSDEWIFKDFPNPDEARLKFEWLDKIMHRKTRPTAVVCAGMGASRNIINFAYRQGFNIPEDLSVVGIGAAWEATSMFPHVSSIQRDISAMLGAAFKILEQRMNKHANITAEKWIEPKLVLRDTVFKI